MASIEVIEIYGIRIDRKQAAMFQMVMEHDAYEFRDRAMRSLESESSPEVLQYIATHHTAYEFRDRAMKALERM